MIDGAFHFAVRPFQLKKKQTFLFSEYYFIGRARGFQYGLRQNVRWADC
jgi:hypothetical protein